MASAACGLGEDLLDPEAVPLLHQPGHLVVVAHGERFPPRPLEVKGENRCLEALNPGEVPLPLDPGDLHSSCLQRQLNSCTSVSAATKAQIP
ncbi:MAG: hypothetical protein ACK41W_12360 [Cyanobacteriota bacterium]